MQCNKKLACTWLLVAGNPADVILVEAASCILLEDQQRDGYLMEAYCSHTFF